MIKRIHIIGGGTFKYVRNHLSLCAPAFGETAKTLHHALLGRYMTIAREKGWERLGRNSEFYRAVVQMIMEGVPEERINCYADTFGIPLDKVLVPVLHLTKMADPRPDNKLTTNEDVAALIDRLVADPTTDAIVMNAAICDFSGQVGDIPSGKHAQRLKTREGQQTMVLAPTDKIISRIRKDRKDIFLVAFKTTTDATEQEQYIAGLNLLKANSVNLVLANDTVTRRNMIIVPEEARYHVTMNREEALQGLTDMISMRAHLHFTRSTVVPGYLVSWYDARIPSNLRAVVNWCIGRGAYKPFRGSTAGHFAVKLGNGEFLTSPRKRDFNDFPDDKVGMVYVETEGNDRVIAYGARPSVGGQSQRQVFAMHPDTDCIIHAHIPLRPGAGLGADGYGPLEIRSQREFECGSHECGFNTATGLREVAPGIKAVMLDNHGPNIVFSRNTPAEHIIKYIEMTFDISQKTGGSIE